MAQDGSTAVFVIQKIVHEQMHRGIERIDRKISDVFRKREQRKSNAEREMGESRLPNHSVSLVQVPQEERTSTHIEGHTRKKHHDN